MEERKFLQLVLLAGLIAGGVALVTPWWSYSLYSIDRNDSPPTDVVGQADYYGDHAVIFSKFGNTETRRSYSYAVENDRRDLGNLFGNLAGVMENTFLIVIVLFILLGTSLLISLFGNRMNLPAATPQLLLGLAALISLFNLVSLPYGVAAASGEGFVGMRSETISNVETRISKMPGAAYFASLFQFLCIGLLLYSARYGVPKLGNRGARPAAPQPLAPMAAPPGYTPTTFVPPPPPDQAPPMQAPASMPPHSAYPPAPVNPGPPPRRSVLDEGHDVIPPAPPSN